MPFDFNHWIIDAPSSTEIENMRIAGRWRARCVLILLACVGEGPQLRDMSPQLSFLNVVPWRPIFKNSFYGSLMDPMVVPSSQVEQGPDMKRMICVSGTMFRQ